MPLGPFTQPDERICFDVPFMNDNECNDDPNLNLTIEMSRQDPNDIGVTISNPVTIIIIDDSMEPECSKLLNKLIYLVKMYIPTWLLHTYQPSRFYRDYPAKRALIPASRH